MTHRDHGHACAGEFAAPGDEAHYPPDLRLEPVHLDIGLAVDLERARVAGEVSVRLRARVDDVASLVLDALAFHDVAVEGDGVDATYDGRRIALGFRRPFRALEERTVTIRYSVERPASGLFFSYPTPEIPDAPKFAITDHETERARHWLPTVDHPAVRPTLAFRVRARADLEVLANGLRTGEERHADGTRTVTYRLDHPCPAYLTCFAVGELVRADGGNVHGLEVSAYAPAPATVEALQRTFGPTSEMLRFLEGRLGVPYPFPKYAQIAAKGIGGAMENISLVTWDDRFLLDAEQEPEERQLVDCINVHEMAHSWFGDLVVCRDFADAWLKESWATYMEAVWLESSSRDAFVFDMHVNADAYFQECDERYRRPIVTRRYATSWEMYDRHLYPGGAWRIHMLRCLLGDAVFWPAVTDYLVTHGGGLAETDDFRRVLERHSGRSLVRFFDAWLRSPGFPEVAVQLAWDAERREATLSFEQKQPDAALGVPCFDLELDVLLVAGGQEHRKHVHLEGRTAALVVPLPAAPDEIQLDPDYRVLARFDFDPGRPRLEKLLTAGRDVRARIDAGRRLLRGGDARAAATVQAAYAREPYWGVRLRWAEALSEAGTEAALGALVELARSERDARVLPGLFRALGRHRDPRVTDALVGRLGGPLGPRAREAALEGLGAQREAAPLALLLEAASTAGPTPFPQAGALRALGATRRVEALGPLVEASRPAARPIRVRPGACTGLGELVRALDRGDAARGIDALADRLRDPDHRVRAAAADGLLRGRAREAEPALRAYQRTLPQQEAVRVDRAITAMMAAAEPAFTEAQRRVELLSADLRRLEGRLEKLESRAGGTKARPPAKVKAGAGKAARKGRAKAKRKR